MIVPTATIPMTIAISMAVNLRLTTDSHYWHDRHSFVQLLPRGGDAALRSSVWALPETAPFEFGVACEAFGLDRTEAAARPSTSASRPPSGRGAVARLLDQRRAGSGVRRRGRPVVVPAHRRGRRDDRYLDVVRAAEDAARGCSASAAVRSSSAQAGILDGRKSTTHWMYTDDSPSVSRTEVDPDVLFVQDRKSSPAPAPPRASTLPAHRAHGARRRRTNVIARRMVVPPQRDGGQSQYIESPVPECRCDSFALVTEWMLENLEQDLTVDVLARRALMSSRTFARKFRAETGTTPAAWLNRQRILRAQQLLEQTDEGLEQIAQLSGFGTAAVMRHHFLKVLRTTPTNYRRTFGERAAG